MKLINADTNSLSVTVDGIPLVLPPQMNYDMQLNTGSVVTTPDGVVRINTPSMVCSFTATTSTAVAGYDWQGNGTNAFWTGLEHGSVFLALLLAVWAVKGSFVWLADVGRDE